MAARLRIAAAGLLTIMGRVAAESAEVTQAKANLEALKKKLAAESAIGWTPIVLTVVVSLVIILITVPCMMWFLMPAAKRGKGGQAGGKKKARRRVRRARWTLDDLSLKPQQLPVEMRGRSDIKSLVQKYADGPRGDDDSDTDSEREDEKKLTPEEIIRRHQQLPRESHVGIFIGVDDPLPNSQGGSAMKHSRCAADARDMAEEFRKLDYKVFCLQDHVKQSDRAYQPTRVNLAKTIRNLKDGRYDEDSRREPNFDAWYTCLLYIASRVRICKVRDDHEVLEFLVRQDMEPSQDGVWIEMTELLNKVSDIPHKQTVVMFDVVHTGREDIQFDAETGEDIPMIGDRQSLEQLMRRTGKTCGLVDNFRCAVVGCTRPAAMPKEVGDAGAKKKMRHGPLAHFVTHGFQDVEKRDPNREVWANMARQGMGGFGGGGGMDEMPAKQPVTVGDLLTCPFHNGNMTPDSTYRFLSRKVRILTDDPACDPYYVSGSVQMIFANQRAMRPREAPETPQYLHECKRAAVVEKVLSLLAPEPTPKKPVSVALLGATGTGKTSIALAAMWSKDSMHTFHDGQFYVSLRKPLSQHAAEGRRVLCELQTTLARQACGYEGTFPSEEAGTEYCWLNFMKEKCVLCADDVRDPEDVLALLRAMGVRHTPGVTVSRRDNGSDKGDEGAHDGPEGDQTVVPSTQWQDAVTPKTGLLITTTDPAVAAACDHVVEVGGLDPEESRQLCAAAAGLLHPGELPPSADALLHGCGHLPMFAQMLGVLLRGKAEEEWDAAQQKVGEFSGAVEKEMPRLLDALLSLLPEEELACLRASAIVPPGRSVVVHALATLWRQVSEEVIDGERRMEMDHNKAHAVLSKLLDLGVGRLVMEDGDPVRKKDMQGGDCPQDTAFLIHPLIAEHLSRGAEEPDKAVIDSYVTAGTQAGELALDAGSADMWAQGPWDGYYHQHIASHLHAVRPELVQRMYANPKWVLFQHDAVKVDKVIADLRRYAWEEGSVQAAVCGALEAAAPVLRRHPWEFLSQLYGRLCGDPRPAVQQFCIDLIEGSKAAAPSDKQFLWLKPLWPCDYFDAKTNNAGSPCTSTGFYKDFLVSGHEDGSVVLWRLADGSKYKTLLGHTKAVHGCLTTHDGRLGTGSKEEDMSCRIRLWDIESGESEAVSVVDKPEQAPRAPSRFDFKHTKGQSGFDPTNGDDCDSEKYKKAKETTVDDAIILEHKSDDDDINCNTWSGWNRQNTCCSMTFGGTQIHAIAQHDYNGKLLIATADDVGRALVWELQTTETIDPDVDGKDSDEEEEDRTITVD